MNTIEHCHTYQHPCGGRNAAYIIMTQPNKVQSQGPGITHVLNLSIIPSYNLADLAGTEAGRSHLLACGLLGAVQDVLAAACNYLAKYRCYLLLIFRVFLYYVMC